MPGTLLLDSEGLARLYLNDRQVAAFVQAATAEGVRVGTTAMTVIEADDARAHPARIRWALSRIDVHDVTREIGNQAAALLREHRLHGHKYASEAAFAVIARSVPDPVTVLTSAPEDLTLLCGPRVLVLGL
ncbi:DNA-binding protein [Kitasatospora sp. NPDC059673]|uniref:DNA-binding protein n=1 Tax=Kitasatospora sp. NPDC059673 TaxID=3346901 RepID=UPI00369A304F